MVVWLLGIFYSLVFMGLLGKAAGRWRFLCGLVREVWINVWMPAKG